MEQPGIGDFVDGFQVVEILHSGASACLYKCIDNQYDKPVVLKIPFDDLLNRPYLLYHYQNEEYLSRYLNHQAIVRFLVRPTSRLYLIQEFIDGSDLKSCLQKEPLIAFEKAVSLCKKVSLALRYLHSQSIIHLDLKPENIMVLPSGEIKLIDFGLARHLGLRDYLSDDFANPHGTPYYIAPEQLCGVRDSFQSDIYSLGIVFYEMLTGKLPFKKSDRLLGVQQRLTCDPVPPRYYNELIPASLQYIILKALKLDFNDRYLNIGEMISDLEAYQDLVVDEQAFSNKKPLTFFDFLRPASCKLFTKKKDTDVTTLHVPSRQILGCLIDDDLASLVIEDVKREALLSGDQITLIVVLEEEIEQQEVEYANEIAGTQFAKRLDSYISYLKKYDLLVTLRIKRGRPAPCIIAMAESINAECIILGPPRVRKPLGSLTALFIGSTIEKIVRAIGHNVKISKPVSSGPGPILKNRIFDEDFQKNLKLFLADIWVYHLNRLMESVNRGAHESESVVEACPYCQWLVDSVCYLCDDETGKKIIDIHSELHGIIAKLIYFRENNKEFIEMYRRQALPLARTFKNLLYKLNGPDEDHIANRREDSE